MFGTIPISFTWSKVTSTLGTIITAAVLRLKSDPNQSLVVKVQDGGSLHAERVRTDIEDSIGGTIQVLGQPGFPVVMTSIHDCEVGAGFTPEGLPQMDTLSSGACTVIDVAPVKVPYLDVIIVMDETVTMGNTQVFTAQLIQDLETALLGRGIGNTAAGGNRYGTVGFASQADPLGRVIPVGCRWRPVRHRRRVRRRGNHGVPQRWCV